MHAVPKKEWVGSYFQRAQVILRCNETSMETKWGFNWASCWCLRSLWFIVNCRRWKARHGFAKHIIVCGSLSGFLHNLLTNRLTLVVQQIKVLDLLILARYFSSNKQIKPYLSTDQHNRKQLFYLYPLSFWKPTEFWFLIGKGSTLIGGIFHLQ